MPDETLAEIVAEGERLEDESLVADRDYLRFCFYREHGPLLLAVAKAALAYREAEVYYRRTVFATNRAERAAWDRREATGAAFDAAAGGKP